MELRDVTFTPHSDTGADDTQIVTEHKNLINNNKFSDASALLNNNCDKGFKASLFNSIQEKILQIQIFLLNKYVAENDELYSIDEPSEDMMKDKKFWIQIEK